MVDIEKLAQIARVTGVGGLAVVGLLIVARGIVAKNIFSTLSPEKSYRLLLQIMWIMFLVALAALLTSVVLELTHNQRASKTETARAVTLRITLRTPERQPLEGAMVMINHYPFGETTRFDGTLMSNIPVSVVDQSLEIFISHPGYKTYHASRAIADNQVAIATVLEPLQTKPSR